MRLNLSKIKFSLTKKKKSGRLTGLPEGIELSGLIHRKWFVKSDSSGHWKVIKIRLVIKIRKCWLIAPSQIMNIILKDSGDQDDITGIIFIFNQTS